VTPLPYTVAAAEEALGREWAKTAVAAYRWMILGRTLDARLQGLQRQGRVGFYGAATGQEAVNVAAGMVSGPDDWIYPGLREQLVALVRGHPLGVYVHHLFADSLDPARGRNMPCHPSAADVHYVSMSSVIGTQVSHAVGTAWGQRRRGTSAVTFAFFGDGATSSNDFHAGLNFAAVLGARVLFCCTNNQWAISIPVERQTRSATLAAKAAAYGFEGIRVDGTDFVAVHAALSRAVGRLRSGGGPLMIEFLLYRMTAHSSSDDPGRYQPADWASRAKANDPVDRLDHWLSTVGLVSPELRATIAQEADAEVRAAIDAAERTPPPSPASVTEDVYSSTAPAAASGRG